ncbi:hypothetical protein BFJ68_g2780 [Fusarium oxysporum]|uniref:Uncharacterized protein n=2 Tax=Fusarium oxysporum TaxID=5507 RepID=A0A420R1R4_FUSOX|nr:hypothetical protein FOMA001_g9611 [Fusarium oxysporum f. sp. matthiolae]RKK16546.1 hypothetical protein BFJ65_g10109 [Fusarium oxysporum f. sp. cepae]RKL10993.1 hypothetical protein BFJ71_g440 [Fusarium oxysporum]RKK40620.1 hypothetical protein BFJ66_g11423 [Fusarium oxysporum f. sp. cepae]RKK60506.1 hypothetical protein BFJ67_g2071 [Fusarium oxysporum f. sp. cepae]
MRTLWGWGLLKEAIPLWIYLCLFGVDFDFDFDFGFGSGLPDNSNSSGLCQRLA